MEGFKQKKPRKQEAYQAWPCLWNASLFDPSFIQAISPEQWAAEVQKNFTGKTCDR